MGDDAGHSAYDDRNEVVAELAVRVEEEEQEPSRQRSTNRPNHNLECHEARAPGTPMSVGKRPLATGTGRHAVEWGCPGRDTLT